MLSIIEIVESQCHWLTKRATKLKLISTSGFAVLVACSILGYSVYFNVMEYREFQHLKKENSQLHKKIGELEFKLAQTNIGINKEKIYIGNIEKDILKLNSKLNPITAHNYASLINEYCPTRGIKPMVAILRQESNFKTTAKNRHGDYGLGQINWKTWHDFFNLKDPKELYDPALNIKLSCKVLELAYIAHKDKDDWWSYYHSWNDIPREKYEQLVRKYLEQIK